MIKRVIEISRAKTHLSVRYDQLLVTQGDETSQIPCEDIGVLIVDHQGVTYTHNVFVKLLEFGTAIVLCGANHHPCGMLLPTAANSEQTARMRIQLKAPEPLKKRLWQQIIKHRIKSQARLLGPDCPAYEGLKELSNNVKSGDPDNREAHASKTFWKYFFGELNFRRRRFGNSPNNLLNYGYTIVRAAIARAIVSAGLNASIGLHHHNKYNAFCLADDLLEAFRGIVEQKVLEVWTNEDQELIEDFAQQIKAAILEVLYQPIEISGASGPLLVGLHKTAASLVKCFSGEQKSLDLPKIK